MAGSDFYVAAHSILSGAPEAPLPARHGGYDVVRLYYSAEDDQFFLVSHDETTALPLPRNYHGQWDELRKPEEDRLRCHSGFVPWAPRGKEPE